MDIETFLTERKVPFTRHEHPTAYTAQEMAAEEHVPGDQVAKAVVVQAGDKPVLCVLPASYKIDLAKLAKGLKVKGCRLAEEAELAKIFTDVEVGAEPPFGNLYGLKTVVDEHLAADERIIFNAGTHRQAIEMAYDDFARLAEPKVLDFSVHL